MFRGQGFQVLRGEFVALFLALGDKGIGRFGGNRGGDGVGEGDFVAAVFNVLLQAVGTHALSSLVMERFWLLLFNYPDFDRTR